MVRSFLFIFVSSCSCLLCVSPFFFLISSLRSYYFPPVCRRGFGSIYSGMVLEGPSAHVWLTQTCRCVGSVDERVHISFMLSPLPLTFIINCLLVSSFPRFSQSSVPNACGTRHRALTVGVHDDAHCFPRTTTIPSLTLPRPYPHPSSFACRRASRHVDGVRFESGQMSTLCFAFHWLRTYTHAHQRT